MPLLTLYRPNFCAECGAKILRLRWFLWTSRKFCDSCARKSRKQRWAAAGLIASSILVTGIIVGHNLKTPPPPLIIQRKEIVAGSSSTNSATETQPATVEEIYTCGARTKKGKPCSRRVHGPVRCWQHKGEKAMLPQEKLKIQE
jgi:hypothetical protein